MKIFIKISDDEYYGAHVTMVAANSLDEAKQIMTGTNSEDEYVQAFVEMHHPKNHRDWYKTGAGWRQAIHQYESFGKERKENEAKCMYRYYSENIHDTGIESQATEPGILWENN